MRGRRSDPLSGSSAMLRHPRRVVLVAMALVGALGALGMNVADRLAPISISMPGTESARGEEQLQRHFGDSAPFAILLRGPAMALDRQGPTLVRALRRDRRVSVLSPWDRQASGKLRPAPRKALILTDFHVPIGEAVTEVAPALEHTVGARVSDPVEPTVTGYPMLWRGLKSANETAAKRGELIAFPLLLVVLLFVFRSPVAAAIPVLFGLATLVSMRGLISLLSGWIEIDPLTLPVSSMIGLALGVDYALLMVSRFREELVERSGPLVAAEVTRRTAGRTLATAGATLFFSLLVALFVVPGQLFAELIGVVMLGTAVSVLIAWTVGPAVLTMLGSRVNRWRIGPPIPPRARWMGLVEGALRRPGAVALLVGLPLLLLALPTVGLELGASSIEQLPKDSRVRQDAETVSRAVGPGWAAPFAVVVSSERGSILDPDRSRAISRWQLRIAADPRVIAVVGPEPIVERLRPLRRFGNDLISPDGEGPLAGLSDLGPRLGRAADGISGLRSGLARAAQGAGLLGTGSARARAGAGAIAAGLDRAASGGERAVVGAERLSAGSRGLLAGQRGARVGALQLRLGLETVMPNVGRRGLGSAKQLKADLMRKAAGDPELEEDAARAAELVTRLTKARNQIHQLRKQAVKLHDGLSELTAGGQKLQEGTARLAAAANGMEQGLSQLHGGSRRLAEGLGSLGSGARTLGRKLAESFHRSAPLQGGLRQASGDAAGESKALERKLSSIRRFSPGIFDSGNFLVSALDGVRERSRPGIEQTVSVQRGGQAVRILVIPEDPLGSPGSMALYDYLQHQAAALEVAARATVGIAGGSAQLIDYGRATRDRIPLLIVAIFLATLGMLVVFLRALWLSLLAALLNLATVGVAFGALALMAQIPDGYPLGGYGVVEVTGALSVFCVAFGLSIDYAVFLLMRMRESYDRDGDHAGAIVVGLEKTARVITGAAAIMTVVFVAFASSRIAIMTQIGAGLAVAVVLDATVVRLVFLPALMLLFGKRLWWLPRPLERLLAPRRRPLAVDGEAVAAGN
jgi:putative drug exporter of the RND superfamily